MKRLEYAPGEGIPFSELEIAPSEERVTRILDAFEPHAQSKQFKATEGVQSLIRLALKLEGKLQDYETILSDDASGRIVSLVLRKIAEERRARMGQEPPRLWFLAAGRHHNHEIDGNIERFVEEKASDLGKSLLVTEYIASGKSIMKIVDILKARGVDFDVATVSLRDDPESAPEYPEDLVSRITYGSVGEEGLKFFRGDALGVHKNKLGPGPHPVKDSVRSDEVRKAREDIDTFAELFLKETNTHL